MRFFFLAATLVVAACGSDAAERSAGVGSSSGGSSSGASGGTFLPGSADAGSEGSSSGGVAAPLDGGALPTTCDDDCRSMTLVVTKGDHHVSFDRAQFGFLRGSSYPRLQVGAYGGGDSSCPSPNGSQPSHAIQLDGVPVPFDTTAFAAGSGITVTLFDFEGDLVSGTTLLTAKSIELTPVAASLDATSAEPFVAFDFHVTFEQGIEATGHAFASHCASIDQN